MGFQARCISIYTENNGVGGAERHLRDLVVNLVDQGYNVRIGCNRNPELLDYLRSVHTNVTVDALPVVTASRTGVFEAARKISVERGHCLQWMRQAADVILRFALLLQNVIVLRQWVKSLQPHILHINNGGYPGGESCRAAAIAGRLVGVPVIGMTIHSLAMPRRSPVIQEVAMDRLISKSLDIAITVSQAGADMLVRRRGFPRRQIACVPNGVVTPTVELKPTRDAWRQLGISQDGLLVGVVGRLDSNKGQDYFLKAASLVLQEMDNIQFAVVGSGPMESEYRALAERLGVATRTVFTGQRHDVLSLMESFDVLVIPTVEYESLPYTLLEAMSVGLPVIATRVGGMVEVIQDNQTGILVAPRDVEELATSLLRLLHDPVERYRLGEAAHVCIQTKYTVARMVERTVDHYDRLLKAV